jgi:small nuclear ribonucleoprotein (snRNP)-like protein
MTEKKIEFIGKLNQVSDILEMALKDISELWEAGEVRLLPDDLKLLAELNGKIRKTTAKIMAFNHGRFGKIVNSEVEKVGKQTKLNQ